MLKQLEKNDERRKGSRMILIDHVSKIVPKALRVFNKQKGMITIGYQDERTGMKIKLCSCGFNFIFNFDIVCVECNYNK